MSSNEQTKTEKTKSPSKKVTKKTETPPEPITEALTKEGSFRTVTSLNLKRSFLSGDIKHCKFIMPEKDFREIIIVGMKNGVTWDEIVRAMITRELSGNEPFAGINNYL